MSVLPRRGPDFRAVGAARITDIHAADVPTVVLGFFHQIMQAQPARFISRNREFHRSPPGLHGVGWAITRFSSLRYLNLSLDQRIYVKLAPKVLSSAAIAAAKQFDRCLDGTVVFGDGNESA